ncbi:hypothetical protein BJ965_003647 [Streptomyces luteogriseus]|uniref:Uncharacterized protein n=1 Tax=Streptomyces luteogriseus TaxID=68233 RepID=A0A7W7GK51_9ACTN|nr:hypothetical protein [Streptomyces luteogriseus]MBB4713765.1 hypothetical protein [Streptomyces luteogriseus]
MKGSHGKEPRTWRWRSRNTLEAGGALQTRATPLLTLDEIDEAARRQVSCRAPGD